MWIGGWCGGGLAGLITAFRVAGDVRFHDRGPQRPDIWHQRPTIMAGPGASGAKRRKADTALSASCLVA
jgi:hypothetical protein